MMSTHSFARFHISPFSPQKAKRLYSDHFDIHDHMFVMNCRLGRDPEMTRFREALIAAHTELKQHASQVPRICADIIKGLPAKRKLFARKNEWIVTMSELIPPSAAAFLSSAPDVVKLELIPSVCRCAGVVGCVVMCCGVL